MRRLLAAALLSIAGAASAQSPQPAAVPTIVAVDLEPGAVHEECMRLEPGMKRRYYWKSSAPVDFNIHYHRGDEVFYPVKRERMRGDGGTFTARTAEDYCWMWTGKTRAKVEGQITK